MSKPVFRKRPKRFDGTPAWKKSSPVSLPDSSEPPTGNSTSTVERPIPVQLSASSKKLAISGNRPGPSTSTDPDSEVESEVESDSESYEYVGKLQGYRLFDCEEYMESLKAHGLCPRCESSLTLSECLIARRGLVSQLKTVCSNSNCDYAVTVSDPYSKKAKSLNRRSEIHRPWPVQHGNFLWYHGHAPPTFLIQVF